MLVCHIQVYGSFHKSVSKCQCRKVVFLPEVYSNISETIFLYVLSSSVVFMRKHIYKIIGMKNPISRLLHQIFNIFLLSGNLGFILCYP